MTWNGKVVGGMVVLEGPPPPEGAKVTVQLEDSSQKSPKTLSETLLGLAGIANGLPSDMAENHDHYIHGAPKRG